MEDHIDEKKTTIIEANALEPKLTTVMSPYGHVVEVVKDKGNDEALKLAEQLENVEIHPEKDRKLLWKLDLFLLPIFALLYLIQFMDKTCTGYASIMGFRDDYDMVGQDYSWTTSCFYLGYLFAMPISSVLLQKLPTMYTTGTCIIVWGVVQCCICATRSYPTLILLRTMLGMLEAFVSPIFVIVLNQYYKKSEHFGRMAVFYGFNGLGTIILAAIAGSIYKKQDSFALRSYYVLFLIIGVWTIVWGFIILALIPNTPAEAKWLTQEEKAMIVARIRGNQQGFGAKEFKLYQIKECVTDIRTWVYFSIAILVAIPNGGVSSFGNIILKSFGYDTLESLYMKAPVGAVELVGLCFLPLLNTLIKSRMFLAEFYMCTVLMATCLLAFTSTHPALAGYYIMGLSPVGIIMVSSCVSSNTAGHTKKLAANAISLIGYSAGNIIGPQTFKASDAPKYHRAKATLVGCYSAVICLIAILTLLNIKENKRRDKLRDEMGDDYHVVKNQEFADLTDFENPEFRYSY